MAVSLHRPLRRGQPLDARRGSGLPRCRQGQRRGRGTTGDTAVSCSTMNKTLWECEGDMVRWSDGNERAKHDIRFYRLVFDGEGASEQHQHIFDARLDVRWVGDEQGFAGTTCWSKINGSSLYIGNASIVGYL